MVRLLAVCALLTPSMAFADPCEGPLPDRAGVPFSGQVRHVIDGDSICVGPSADRETWIEVRIADFNAPEMQSEGGPQAKSTMERLALGKPALCESQAGRSGGVRSYDRVIAACWVGSQSIGDMMRATGVTEGGR